MEWLYQVWNRRISRALFDDDDSIITIFDARLRTFQSGYSLSCV